jgi:hypothetical protein
LCRRQVGECEQLDQQLGRGDSLQSEAQEKEKEEGEAAPQTLAITLLESPILVALQLRQRLIK